MTLNIADAPAWAFAALAAAWLAHGWIVTPDPAPCSVTVEACAAVCEGAVAAWGCHECRCAGGGE